MASAVNVSNPIATIVFRILSRQGVSVLMPTEEVTRSTQVTFELKLLQKWIKLSEILCIPCKCSVNAMKPCPDSFSLLRLSYIRRKKSFARRETSLMKFLKSRDAS